MDKAGQRTEDSNFEVRVVRHISSDVQGGGGGVRDAALCSAFSADRYCYGDFLRGHAQRQRQHSALALAVLSPRRQGATQRLEDEVEGEFILFCHDWELALIPSISG